MQKPPQTRRQRYLRALKIFPKIDSNLKSQRLMMLKPIETKKLATKEIIIKENSHSNKSTGLLKDKISKGMKSLPKNDSEQEEEINL